MLKISSKIQLYSAESAKLWVQQLNKNTLPQNLLNFRYDRSSGPGGQNVNKLSTKCTLTVYNVSQCGLFPEEVQDQLLSQPGSKKSSLKFRYYSPVSDSIVVQSDKTRSRMSNKEICIDKLISEIKSCCYFPEETDSRTKNKWIKVKKNSNETRLRNKKLHSDKKKARKAVSKL